MRRRSIFAFLLLLAALSVRVVAQPSPPAPPPGAVICANFSQTPGTSSANMVLPSTNANCRWVTWVNVGAIEAFVNWGGSSVAATTSSLSVPSGMAVSQYVGTATYVAAITASSSTTLRIIQANGPGSYAQLGTGTVTPPPVCSDALDFSKACNSQYVAALF